MNFCVLVEQFLMHLLLSNVVCFSGDFERVRKSDVTSPLSPLSPLHGAVGGRIPSDSTDKTITPTSPAPHHPKPDRCEACRSFAGGQNGYISTDEKSKVNDFCDY